MSDIRAKLNKNRLLALFCAALLAAPPLSVTAASAPVPATAPGGSIYDIEMLKDAGYQIPDKGCSLFIDLDNCNMLVFIDGRPYKAYPVSGGTNETPSPVGTWRVVEISNWGEGFGGSWIGLSVPWGIYGIHGTVAPWFLGEYNVSHGCIRMRDEDVKEVKKLITYGTIVHIKQNSAPFRPMESGMVGSDVQRAQKMLRQLGYYYGGADGVFGGGMERAVRKFQRDNKLWEDGIVGRRTYETLKAQTGTPAQETKPEA